MIKQVSFLQNLEVIVPVIRTSYLESEDQNLSLKIDLHSLGEMEMEGRLVTLVNVGEDDKITGLLIFNLYDNLHHAAQVFMESRIFFIDPSMRGTSLLRDMLSVMEEVAKKIGVDKIHIGSRKRSAYFNRLGYEEDQVTYTKFIGESS